MILLLTVLLTQPPSVSDAPTNRSQTTTTSTTTRAERFIAETPCTARWTHGEHAIGPAPEPWAVLRCVVPPVADPVEMRGRWYLQDADRSWWAQGPQPGTWVRVEKVP